MPGVPVSVADLSPKAVPLVVLSFHWRSEPSVDRDVEVGVRGVSSAWRPNEFVEVYDILSSMISCRASCDSWPGAGDASS